MWFATYTQGLYCLDVKGNLSAYTITNSKIVTNYIADLSCLDGRNLYIATSTGFYHMDVITRNIITLDTDINSNEIVKDHFVNCIFQDSRGLIWTGGRKGVSIYNPTENKVVYLTEDDGLSHSYIRAITEDSNKNIWISTDHGISHVVVDSKGSQPFIFRCYPYFENDGIGNFAFNNFSIICNRNKEILIGGSGGYLKIKPVFLNMRPVNQQAIFTGLYVANQRIEPGTPLADGRMLLSNNISMTKEVTLNYSDTNFSIDVSAMDFGNLHKIKYDYRIGVNDDWVRLDGNRVNFNKLAPGSYLLQVKVCTRPDKAVSEPISLMIHIKPPFWMSTWAYCLYAVAFFIMILLYIRFLRRKHKRLLAHQTRELEIAKLHEMDEAKMHFFTNVSHDLRTPLSMIITPLERLISNPERAQLKDNLVLMHRNAMILLDEVNQLLDFRKLDAKETKLYPSYGNLSDFIKDVSQSFASLCTTRQIELNLQINAPVIEMNFDRNKMQRVFLNLLSNALKYNNDGGSITVTVDKVLVNEGEHVRIKIADTGIGIKDENKKKVFDRFFQEHHAATTYVGNGIGLHIVKEYITLHEGIIEVKDNKPQGTVFIITIPAKTDNDIIVSSSKEVVLNEAEESDKEDITISKCPRILIVEDNTDFRNFLINSLEEDYEVFSAGNGKEALDVLAQHPLQIVISDIMMPVMDGIQLCQKIKNDIRYSHIPVILLTARTAEEQILNGYREGADDYITKPFNLELLNLRIKKLLYWTQNNHERFKTIEVSPSEITISSLDEKLIDKAIKAVETNMDNSEFSVEDLSDHVGMSRGHLYKKLISITGKSPLEFIRTLRVKRGHQLLTQSQLSISQISYQVGLSPKQFSKYYKEEFGCLPSEFKKQT